MEENSKEENVVSETLEPKVWDRETVQEMKRLGMSRPQGCPVSMWSEPIELNHTHDKIIEMMLDGFNKTQIAKHLDLDYIHLVTITNSPLFKDEYRRLRNDREENISKARIHGMFGDAIMTIKEVMNDREEKGSTRLQAASYVIDQSVGKAKQDLEVKSTVLSDVLIRIEELKSRSVSEIEPSLDKPKDDIDNFVDSYITEEFKVGQRGVSTDGERSE